jgi:CRISPR/Cas system-associated exonuclease Cas4 (RecB family)
MADQITAWSYSRWNDYESCPRKAFYKHVKKMKEPSSPALERGSANHKVMEDYITKKTRTMPKPEVLHPDLRPMVKALRKLPLMVEQELAFTKKWRRTGWFDHDAWVRVKMDVLVPPNKDGVVDVVDWKTGKVKEKGEYDDQLELYQLSSLLIYPEAKQATARLPFLDHGKVIETERTAVQPDVAKLCKAWEKRTSPMLNDKVFAPRPGNACRWCHFRKANNGPCDY